MPMTASDVELRENSIGLTLGVPRLSSVSRESSLAGASLGGPLGAAWRLGDHSGLAPAGARAVPSSLVGAAAGSGAVGSVVNRESITSLNSDAIGSGSVNISQLQAQFPAIFGLAGEDSMQSNSSIDMLREDSASIMYSSANCLSARARCLHVLFRVCACIAAVIKRPYCIATPTAVLNVLHPYAHAISISASFPLFFPSLPQRPLWISSPSQPLPLSVSHSLYLARENTRENSTTAQNNSSFASTTSFQSHAGMCPARLRTRQRQPEMQAHFQRERGGVREGGGREREKETHTVYTRTCARTHTHKHTHRERERE